MHYDVFGVGNALVDIQAKISDEHLERVGFTKGVMTLVDEPTQLRVLDSLNGSPLNRCAGGSAANTIVGIADFGGKAAYAGKVASDELGTFFLDDMRKLGVTIEVPPGYGTKRLLRRAHHRRCPADDAYPPGRFRDHRPG